MESNIHLLPILLHRSLHSINATKENRFYRLIFVLVQFNQLLRDIFGLGPPLILDAAVKGNKISRFEKVTAASAETI